MSRPSFWSRLTGAFEEEETAASSYPQEVDYPYTPPEEPASSYPQRVVQAAYAEPAAARHISPYEAAAAPTLAQEEEEGELSIDLYETPEELIVKAIVAGVKPDDLDISLSRDLITIRGSRAPGREAEEANTLIQEVFWGTFSRTLSLPSEIDIEAAQATVKDGVLTIRLPKIDKHRERKIKVKSL